MATTIYMDRADKNKIGIFEIEDVRVIPIIFLPGIMGSNLKETKSGKIVWRYDSAGSLLSWSTPSSGPEQRKRLLHPDRVEVDDQGIILLSSGTQSQISKIRPSASIYDDQENKRYDEELKEVMESNEPESKLFCSRRERGWGEVANASYGSFLDALQTALYRDKPNTKSKNLNTIYQELMNEVLGLEFGPDSLSSDCIDVMKLYQFPVHAIGYNWLSSNIFSAQLLENKINKTIMDYKNRGMKCSKVIVVTHSMGGLVARYYSECLGGSENIYGVIHGVMPSIGAAAAYTRMKRGTENSASNLTGYITSHILGRNAAEMTAICSQSPGPLELLPTTSYRNDWLNIVDRNGCTMSLPKNLPGNENNSSEDKLYSGIFLNRKNWWKLIDENLLNPMNISLNKLQMDVDWKMYQSLIIDNVIPFHKAIDGKYHSNTYSFYGKVTDELIVSEYLTQEIVIWSGSIANGRKNLGGQHSKLDDGRLNLNETGFIRTVKSKLSKEEQLWEAQGYDGEKYIRIGEVYTLKDASENGDGTVPLISGKIVHTNIKERFAVKVSHESAYRDELCFLFTLRSIIKIAQQARDDVEMSYE